MDPSYSCIEHDVKIKEEPIDEYEENISDEHSIQLKNGWFEFKCNSGKVLFYFNSITNEHRWMGNNCTCLKEDVEEENSESIGIQCDIDDRSKPILSKDVATEIDVSLLVVQESRNAVSVQTEVSFLQDNSSFRDIGVMTFSEDESISPSESISTEGDPLIHDNNEQVGTLIKDVVDPEDVTKDPTLTLNSSSTKDEPGVYSKDDELIKKENPKVLSQLDDDKHSEHHSDAENSPKELASLKNSDCENLSEEKSSASSCATANEHNEGINGKIVDENTILNDIVSEEQYSKERDGTSLIVQSDNHVIAKTSSENKDLSEVEKRCEETGVISAHICKNFNKNESSDFLSHGNPSSKDEEWEQGSDLRPSNEAFQLENLNTPSDNSVEKDLHQENACLSFEKTIDEQSFDNTTKDIENSCDDVCDLENDQPKEDQYKESEQHATQVSCQKIGRQTARKCADSLRKCLMIQKKAPELSNTENSTKDKRKCLRKRKLKKRICTDRFSKRLKVLVIPLEQDLPRIEVQLKSTCNTGTNDTVTLDNIIHILKHDYSYFCSEEERQSQTEHEVSESESYNIGDIIPNRKNSGPTSIEPQNGSALFPNIECSDENKQSENDQPLVGRNHEASVVNQVFEKSIEDEFQNKDDQNEPKQSPKNPDNDRQEDLSIKEICVKKSIGFDENDERDTQGKAKDKIQNLEDQLKDLPKMDEKGIVQVFNENDCQNRNINNNNDENQNKAIKANQHLEDHLEDFSMKEENEEVSKRNEPQNRNVEKNEENDAQYKAKKNTEKIEDNQENLPMADTNYQVSKEIETQNENSVKNNEDKAENKTDEHREKDEPQRNDQANLVVGYTMKDGSGGIPNEKEIEKTKRCGDASQKEADETKSKYESQNQEKCPQNISAVEASGQVSIESEEVSEGNEDIRNVTDEGDSEDIMPERGANETSSIMNSQSYEPNTSIKPLLTKKVVEVTPAANKDAVRYPNTRRYRRPDLKCKICGRGFKSRFKLSCHLKGHNRAKTNTCRFCLRTFRSYSLLCDHLKYHNMVSKYRCSYCNESFISHQKLVSHFIKCSETKTTPQNSSSISDTAKCGVPSSETSPLKNDPQLDNVTSPTTNELICNICKMAYVYPTSFKKHLDLHAAMPNGPANEIVLKESYKSFENYMSSGNSKLKSVLEDMISPTDSNGDTSESQTIPSGDSKDENDESPLDCPVCGMHFKMEYWLNCHIKKKHGMSTMETSTVLGDVTSSTDSNDDPSKSQTSPSNDSKGGNDESPISCPVCGMHFKMEYWLNCHIKKKHGMEYWLSCHVKKKRGVSTMETSTVLKDVTSPTDSNAEVSESQAIPSGESKDENYKGPLDCPVCGMLFKKEYWLNYHIGKKHGISAMGGPPETNRDSKTNTSNNAKENPRCLEKDTSPKTMATESTNIQTNKDGDIGENVDKLVSSPLKCQECGIQFKRESWYDRHMKKKHLMSKERFALFSSPQASEHKNDETNETLETSKGTKESQENHVLAQGRTENVPEDGPKHSEGKQVFQCDICNREFIYFGSLGNHMKHKHPGLENRNLNEKTRTDVPEIPKDANLKSAFEVKKNAGTAGRSFPRTEMCSNNDNVVIGYKQNNFKCCECREEFPHLDDLIKHSSEKHVARKCQECEYSCSSSEEFHSHVQIHRREAAADRIKKICCKICGKEVSTALELITHFRTHKRGRKRKIDETQEVQSTSKSIEPTGSSSSDAPNSKIGIKDPEETLSQRAIPNLSESSNPIVSNPTSKNDIRLSVFFCLVCNKAFSSIRKRSLHMKRSHPDSKKKKGIIQTKHKIARHRYKCPACGRNFRKIKYFNQHKCENKDMEPTEQLTDNTESSFVSRNTLEVNEGSQNSDGSIPQDRLFSKGHTPAINGDPCFDPSTERCVSGDTDIKMKCNSPRRKHWKCSICDRSFYKIKSYNKHKRSHEIMQSTEPTDVPKNNLSCSPTNILPSKDINTSAIQDNLGLVPSGNLVALPRKDESAYTSDKPKETTRQEKISKISNIETIWEDKNAVGTESASVCNSETSSGASSTNESKNETRSPSKSVFQYLNLETHSCGNLVGNEFKCYYCSLSFSSFYRRNSHVFTTHKRESKERHPLKGPDSPMETNQGNISQATNDTSPQMVLNSYELPKSMDKEFSNSRMQDVNLNDESFKKKKHVPNILRKTNIE